MTWLPCCGGEHEPDTPDMYIDFRGYRFRTPFLCICCGKEICARQFAFGRACGTCDTGACQQYPQAAHERPNWYHIYGPEMLYRFVQFVEAEHLGTR